MNLSDRVLQLCEQHGSLRAAARAVQIDASYLSRLLSGEKVNPSALYLRRLGLKRIIQYSLAKGGGQ